MAMASQTMILQDSETNKMYNITVTAEEAERIKKDAGFAAMKLHEAMVMSGEGACEDTNEMSSGGPTDITESSTEVLHERNENISEDVGVFKWPHEAILLLIEEYRLRQNDFTTGKMSHKKIWLLIAQEMAKHGYTLTGPQCLSKLTSLKRTYKAVKDHNNKSGNSTRAWPYLSLMDELLGSQPIMTPVATVSSTGKRTISHSNVSNSEKSVDTCENVQHKKPRQTDIVEKLLTELKENRRIAEANEERRHNENMQIRERLLTSFEKMIDLFSKKS